MTRSSPASPHSPAYPHRPSLGRLAGPLVEALIADATRLRLGVSRCTSRARLVDSGIRARGGIEAGRRIAEICLGGLGRVSVSSGGKGWLVSVGSTDPVLACLGSQYAGWSLQHEADGDAFFALSSGPGRALAGKEEIFAELGYRDEAEHAVLVMEVDRLPPAPLLSRVAEDCGVKPENLTVILTPTRSLSGTVQIVARSLEVGLHKAHALGFALSDIVDGLGMAPLPPPAADFVAAMGRTNDAILYGGMVHLFVDGAEDAARDLAERLPSTTSRDWGRPFAETFAACGGDFYKIDPMLFSPGLVRVTALATGRTFERGRIDGDLLKRSFALEG